MGTLQALVLAPFAPDQLERLRHRGEVAYESWTDTKVLIDPDKLTHRLNTNKIDILVVEADFVFEETIQKAKYLNLIAVCRTAVNSVDVDAATDHGILVVNAPGRNANAVAEYALGLMLGLARRIPFSHEYTKQRNWQDPTEPYLSLRGVELGGKTLGIVGLGNVGIHLSTIVKGIGMRILAYDPYMTDAPCGVEFSTLENLMHLSDFISIHVPLNSGTETLIDGDLLSRMKRSAYIINCSDFAVIDQSALLYTLETNRIAGAAFDVFETHPVAPDHPFLELANVVLSPHVAGATYETVERHSRMVTDDIIRFLNRDQPVNLVNSAAWDGDNG